MTATELKKRAIALAEKTKIDSVTPEEVGQLSNDIVEYIENVEINGSSLGIRKTYTSVSAMEADSTAPKDDKGVLLRRGMLVNIYNQEYPESADNGKVFSFQNPGWAFRGTVDAGYATKEELTELDREMRIEDNIDIYLSKHESIVNKSKFYSGEIGRTIVENSSRYNCFLPIPCKKGDIFKISTIGGNNGVAYYITDYSKNVLSMDNKSTNYIDNPLELEITDDNAYFLYANCVANIGSDNYNKAFVKKENSDLQNQLNPIKNSIDVIENTIKEFPPIYAKDGGDEVKISNYFSGEVGGKIMANGSFYNSFMPIPCKKGDIIDICTKGGQNGVAYYVTDEEQTILSMDSKGTDYIDAPIKLRIADENAALLFINIIIAPTSTESYNKVFYKRYSTFTLLEDRVKKLENGIGSKITDRTTEYFKVKVTGKPWLSDNNFTSQSSDILIDGTEYDDNCIYYQPECIDKPVKLVIACHGGSQYVGSDESEGLNMGNPLTILQKLGYAYLCCNCYPYDYMHGVLGIGTGALSDSAPVGNWTIMQSYSKALNYVLDKYNIDKDSIFLMGVSQGGMTAENIAELMDINFKAECILEPAISMQFVQPSIRKEYIQAMYGFSTPEEFTIDKVHGLDPFSRNTDSDTGLNKNSTFEECIAITTKKYRKGSPLLILQGDADVTVPAKWTAAYAKMIHNAGGQCEYILYKGLGHGSLQDGNKGSIGGTPFGAPCIEMARWFEKFGGYSTENIQIVE